MNNNLQINFRLQGIASILIGAFIFGVSYGIRTIIADFLVDDSTAGMLSVEILELLGIAILFLLFLSASLTLFFTGKKAAKKINYQLWNKASKNALRKYLLIVSFIFGGILILFYAGFVNYVTPFFLISYSALLFIFKNKARKNLLILCGICLLFATMCLLIPSYWYSSLTVLAIAHVTYGVVTKE